MLFIPIVWHASIAAIWLPRMTGDILSLVSWGSCHRLLNPLVRPGCVKRVTPMSNCLSPAKLQAQVLANEPEQVPAPAPSRDLRLLCLLVPSRTGGPRSLPVHTLRPVPPRVSVQGRWNLASEAGFHLRETQATAPSPEVLERYSRLGQANAFRAHSRAVRTRELSQ